jgi:hypothetical protein
MADDNFTQRPHRASQPPVRSAQASAPQSSGNDPLAELARLIGQTDPFAEYGRSGGQPAPPPMHEPGAAPGYDEADFASAPAESAPAMAQRFAQPDYAEPAYPAGPYAQGPVPGYSPEEGQPGFEPGPFYPNIPHDVAEEEHFYDDAPPRRRVGILAVAAVFALAVIGTAGAFGYRVLFGSTSPATPPPVIKADGTPSKIVPAQTKDAKSGKLIYDRVANGPQDEKLVSREEQPVDLGRDKKPVGSILPQRQALASSGTIQQPAMGSGVVGVEPKKIHTIAIRPNQLASAAPGVPPAAAAPSPSPTRAPPAEPVRPAPQVPPKQNVQAAQPAPAPRADPPVQRTAQSRNAPLSLNPSSPAPAAPARTVPRPRAASAPTQLAPTRTAAPSPIAPAARSGSGGYAVQVASRHNEADAQASLQSLQAKFPQQLGGHSRLIRRVDLGAKGIYYRAMVGPFGSAEEASRICSSLKAAGGDCIVQKI